MPDYYHDKCKGRVIFCIVNELPFCDKCNCGLENCELQHQWNEIPQNDIDVICCRLGLTG